MRCYGNPFSFTQKWNNGSHVFLLYKFIFSLHDTTKKQEDSLSQHKTEVILKRELKHITGK